jgi:hypothetical protein
MSRLGFTKKFLIWSNATVWTWLLGAFSNRVVVNANQGYMPVLIHGHVYPSFDGALVVMDPRHIVMTADTHLKILGDYIPYGGYFNSPGDLLLDLASVSAVILAAVVVNSLLNKTSTWMSK